ncbi:LEAF RUST 10 DISEASE-RESISTANCE LOCUS RECEPTOR-LIKE PROTEIN KINASE-like 1.2 [Phragmites australis]|uniref:LEAF RUST 10 DISEASE-RESISTANCE LOCUS RECEPTOR-LIKE PROTEIN KINASE-like 1.2 n=1 Tax=Phragmites australis TaxID=29695 RepID=UPI002D79D9FD|nr:LEAF RUST 10 DISEASE-RESISTANCE LOCUS RECEPTOR-LIKE PROTEIN KINASE-like 1.2 [Phragmites australis]
MALELLTVALASLLHVAGAIDNTTASCTPAKCGSLDITYPFSLSGVQPLYCGHPALELACDAGRAYLRRTYREHLYRIQDISYENNSLVVAVETTFAGDATCSVPDFNVSSSLAPLPDFETLPCA